MSQLSLEEQIRAAIGSLKTMFTNQEQQAYAPPEDATVESLWAMVLELKKEIHGLKKTKRGIKPKVEDAVRLLVEDPALCQIPIPMIAELIREVFKSYGLPSKCSESSVRWYLSQFSLEWDICRRQMPSVEVINVDRPTE